MHDRGRIRAGVLHWLASVLGVPDRIANRNRSASPSVRTPPAPALRLPRPGPDRAADGAGQHRHPADPDRGHAHSADRRELLHHGWSPRDHVVEERRSSPLLALGALPFLNVAATRFSQTYRPDQPPDPAGAGRSLGRRRRDASSGSGWSRGSAPSVSRSADSRPKPIRCSTGRSPPRACGPGSCRSSTSFPRSRWSRSSGTAVTWCSTANLEIGDILAFNLYILMLIWPLRMMGMLVAQASRASAGGGRVDEILATDPAVADPPDPADAARRARVSCASKSVRFGYGPGRSVLNDFDLTIRGGRGRRDRRRDREREDDRCPVGAAFLRRRRGCRSARRRRHPNPAGR